MEIIRHILEKLNKFALIKYFLICKVILNIIKVFTFIYCSCDRGH